MLPRVLPLSVPILGVWSLIFLGCQPEAQESPYVEHCKAYLEAIVKSPASLSIVETTEEEFLANEKSVLIVYDAANSFGALLRGEIKCKYPEDTYWWEESPPPLGNGPIMPDRLVPYDIELNGESMGGTSDEPVPEIMITNFDAWRILRRKEKQSG